VSLALVNESLFAGFSRTTSKKNSHPRLLPKGRPSFCGIQGFGATCSFRYQGQTRAVSKAVTEEYDRVGRSAIEQEELSRVRSELGLQPARSSPGCYRCQAD